jgi:hypothetical protein
MGKMIQDSKKTKESKDRMAVYIAMNNTKEWAINHPFIATEATAMKHFTRVLKKYIKLEGRKSKHENTSS